MAKSRISSGREALKLLLTNPNHSSYQVDEANLSSVVTEESLNNVAKVKNIMRDSASPPLSHYI